MPPPVGQTDTQAQVGQTHTQPCYTHTTHTVHAALLHILHIQQREETHIWANIHNSLRTQAGTFSPPPLTCFFFFFSFFWHSLDYLLHTRFARGGHSWHHATRGEGAQQACRSREEALRPTLRPHTQVAWGQSAHVSHATRGQLPLRAKSAPSVPLTRKGVEA